MTDKFSTFHAIGDLDPAIPDANGMTGASFDVPRRRPAPPTPLARSDGLTIALPTFEFALVLAGAVSAGAYTAGVIDFLVETLDRWEAQKRADFEQFGLDYGRWSVPPHAVRLRVVAGASAGSVVGAILAASAHADFPSGASLPGRPDTSGRSATTTPPHPNPFYNAWVRQIDIRAMLANDDLEALAGADADHPAFLRLASVLNVGPLARIAAHVITAPLTPRATPRKWLDQEVKFAFTIGNLTGVPYRYQLVGLEGAEFATTRHADLFHFRIEPGVAGARFRPHVEGGELPPATAWQRVAEAALASAAFPIALQSRWLEKPADCPEDAILLDPRLRDNPDRGFDQWTQAADVVGGYVNTTYQQATMRFAAVDGGTMNNQPFEFARRALAGPLGVIASDGADADRAVVLIDPFPAPSEARQEQSMADLATGQTPPPLPIFQALPQLFSAYTAQARFDANNLLLATDRDTYSRYMLSPMRADPTPGSWRTFTGAQAIASGRLGAFAGFLSEAFRHHDFLLGRRNAENFLRNYFSLPAENPLFRPPGALRGAGAANSDFWADKGQPTAPVGPYWTITCDGTGTHERAIIPVPIARADWPAHQPAIGLPLPPEADADQLAAVEKARKLAVRARLRTPTPPWPDPAGQAAGLVAELEPPVRARVAQLTGLGLKAVALNGVVGGIYRLIRPLAAKPIVALATRKVLDAIAAGLRDPG